MEVEEELQSEVHDGIYQFKAETVVSPQVAQNYEKYIKMLGSKGCKGIILGCTEIPLIVNNRTEWDGVKLINPVQVMADALVDVGQNGNVERYLLD